VSSSIALERFLPRIVPTATGSRLTSIPRTLLDLAGVADQPTVNRAAEEADKDRLLEIDALRAIRKRCRGHRGVRKLDALLADLHEPDDVRSPLESLFLELCRAHGIPLPSVNVLVEGFLVDCHWPRERLVIELDSWGHHGNRQAWERDHARDAALRIVGYEIHRLTWRRVTGEPARVAAEIRELLRRRDPRAAADTPGTRPTMRGPRRRSSVGRALHS
jgi:Protein of unknown function (DUF559)